MFISIQSAPWFSWTNNAISDLGREQYDILLFNYSLIVLGFLLLFFTFGLNYSLKNERFGPTFLSISSLYFIAVGIFPLPDQYHIDFSSLFFIAFPLGFFALGLKMYKMKYEFIKKMGIFALIIGIVAACSSVFLIFFQGIAIPEMLILIPGFIWCMIYGLHLIFSNNYLYN
jgi:hypothetical membrane protein